MSAQENLTDSRQEIQVGSNQTGIQTLWRASEDGCEQCDHSGYRGRIGIYEVLASSPEVQKLIVGQHTSDEIQAQSVKEGTVTMQIDGLIKALWGITSLEEILRVTAES